MIHLKQSTASQEVPLGHFVDSTDGVTAMTALSIANTDIKVWVAGATTLANKNSGGATHISGGIYYAVLDATDTATVGPLVLFVAVSGALAVRLECEVLPANVYDALYGADLLQVDVEQFGNSNLTAASGVPEVKVASIAADAVSAAALASDAGTEIGTAVWATTTRALTILDEDSTTLDLDATIRSAVGMSSANLDTQLDAIPTNTDLSTALGTADDAVLAAIAALNNLSSSAAAAAVLTTQMTESYAANGSAPTLAQAIFAVHQALMEFGIAGTSKTVKKLDHNTTAFVITHDSATAPTAAARS